MRLGVALVLLWVIALVLLTVIGFWVAAIYLAIAIALPHAIAALLTGAGVLVIALILIWIAIKLSH